MTTKQEKYKASLVRKYHTLCTKLGWTKGDRLEFLINNYGVESSKDLYIDELKHICEVLAKTPAVRDAKRQEACDRVFGAVGGWLDILYGKVDKSDTVKYQERIRYIKAIACRQTEYDDFNKIPIERLANVSFLFSNKQKDYKAGKVSVDNELAQMACLN